MFFKDYRIRLEYDRLSDSLIVKDNGGNQDIAIAILASLNRYCRMCNIPPDIKELLCKGKVEFLVTDCQDPEFAPWGSVGVVKLPQALFGQDKDANVMFFKVVHESIHYLHWVIDPASYEKRHGCRDGTWSDAEDCLTITGNVSVIPTLEQYAETVAGKPLGMKSKSRQAEQLLLEGNDFSLVSEGVKAVLARHSVSERLIPALCSIIQKEYSAAYGSLLPSEHQKLVQLQKLPSENQLRVSLGYTERESHTDSGLQKPQPIQLSRYQQDMLDCMIDTHVNIIDRKEAKQAIQEGISQIDPKNMEYFLDKLLENVVATQERDPDLLPISSSLDLSTFKECIEKTVSQTQTRDFAAKPPEQHLVEDSLERAKDTSDYEYEHSRDDHHIPEF